MPKEQAQPKLTPKQKTFVQEYLVDLNATQAAIRAGYSAKTARQVGAENLSKPVIQEFIQAAMNKRSERTEITADYVLYGIKAIVEQCTSQKTIVNEDGTETVVGNFDPQPALKGLELLGKHLKIFVDRAELTGKDGKELATGNPIINLTLNK